MSHSLLAEQLSFQTVNCLANLYSLLLDYDCSKKHLYCKFTALSFLVFIKVDFSFTAYKADYYS